MAKYHHRVECSTEGCKNMSDIPATSQSQLRDIKKRYQANPFKCYACLYPERHLIRNGSNKVEVSFTELNGWLVDDVTGRKSKNIYFSQINPSMFLEAADVPSGYKVRITLEVVSPFQCETCQDSGLKPCTWCENSNGRNYFGGDCIVCSGSGQIECSECGK